MKLTIQLRYHTQFGQTLFLCCDHSVLGGGEPVPMRYVNEQTWEIALNVPPASYPKTPVSYYFLVRNTGGSTREDFGNDRKLDFAALGGKDTVILDSWNDLETVENVFFTEPFRKVLAKIEPQQPKPKALAGAAHTFQVKSPLLPAGQTVCLLGQGSAFGHWNQDNPVLLWHDPETGSFNAQIDLSKETFPLDYKYGFFDLQKKQFIRYEDGENRVLANPPPDDSRVLVRDGFVRSAGQRWRGAGVSIPVFSLRSERSFGVGEFLDLPLLADWAKHVGLKLIQILPVNDTSATHTWMDSYPYAAVSAFALHPLYLNLDRLAAEDKPWLEDLAGQRQQLNALPALDYEAVMKAKLDFVRKIFPARRKRTLAGADYRSFFTQNQDWLEPYAAFCFLRDKFKTADFTKWGEHAAYEAKKTHARLENDPGAREEMDLCYFTQFHLHLQLREATDYLHSKGLILKGDIAIGVSGHSADVWQQPGLFNTDMQAGAPPDPFAAKGQNWGFPTYNWPRMAQDGYDWWKRRFEQMGRYFDAFRVDHILGFFRIWSIPGDAVEGILGYFVPALPVRLEEFSARGIALDQTRFTQPFINDAVLLDVFGDGAEGVKREFLNRTADGAYALKTEFSTQRKVEDHFAKRGNSASETKLKIGLFDLISNVLLIEPRNGKEGEFHFRLGMEQTSSFLALDQESQMRLRDLYLDYFFRRQDDFWKLQAEEKLRRLKRVTNMLICGEDLGMVPPCVPVVMKELALLGLEIQRMPKGENHGFSRPSDAPYLSVVTPGTHDMSTLRGWWREDAKLTQKFFNEDLKQTGSAPSDCETWIVREIIRQHLASPAMWSIFPLQDLLGMDEKLQRSDIDAERINVPANPKNYWHYRMHLTLEKLGHEEWFRQLVADLVNKAGR